MFRFVRPLSAFASILVSMALIGCGVGTPSGATKKDGGHAHPEHGPHAGMLIELGEEEYHGELVHDEKAGTVTVYLLDGAGKNSVGIEAAEVTINVKQGEKASQFKLAASRESTDPEGKSSKFVSSEKALGEALDDEKAEAHLVVSIGGKQFRGKIDAHHDHAGHSH